MGISKSTKWGIEMAAEKCPTPTSAATMICQLVEIEDLEVTVDEDVLSIDYHCPQTEDELTEVLQEVGWENVEYEDDVVYYCYSWS